MNEVSYSLDYNESNSNSYYNNEENQAYFNQSIEHYYNLENRPLPKKFRCDVCSIGFYTHGHYQKHIDEHEKCPFPKCELEGNTKFIEQHILFNHMMVNFEATLVDAETWKAERSKRFPSSENIEKRRLLQVELLKKERLRKEAKLKKEQQRLSKNEERKIQKDSISEEGIDWIVKRNEKFPRMGGENLKKAEEIERSKRGERLGKDSRRFPKHDTKGKGSRLKYRKYGKDYEESQEFKSNMPKDEDDCSDSEERYGIPAFKGTKAFYESLGEVSLFGIKSDCVSKEKPEEPEISDDEFDNCNEQPLEKKKKLCVLQNALGSLMGAYGSDSDEDEKENSLNEQLPTPSNCIKEVDSIKATEVTPNVSDDKLKENPFKRKRKHRKGFSKDGNESCPKLKGNKMSSIKFSDRYRRRTLLRKLLEPQIIHERNVILQCVRYIVDNNFFDSEKLSS